MISGIYKILNKVNMKFYIGSTINFNKRFQSHRYLLRKNNHENILLQNAWNKYGEECFEFIILEECDLPLLTIREQFYIDTLSTTNRLIGYNLSPTANSTLGFKFSKESKQKMSLKKEGLKLRLGATLTNETKKKISIANKGKSHPQSEETKKKISLGNKGKKRTKEHKELYSKLKKEYYSQIPKKPKKIKVKTYTRKEINRGEKNGNSTLTELIVLSIRKDYENKFNYKDLVKKYNLNYNQIYKIVKKLRWNWL